MHDMLYTKCLNWATDLKPVEKNGTFLIKDEDGVIQERTDIKDSYQEIAKAVDPLIYPEEKFTCKVIDMDCVTSAKLG